MEALAVSPRVSREMPLPHAQGIDLGSFMALTQVVASGTMSDRMCYVTTDHRWIASAYTFTIDTVFKGGIGVGDHLTVAVPGGRVALGRESWVQLRVEHLLLYHGRIVDELLRDVRAATGK